MSNLSAGLDDGILGLVDDRIRSVLVLEPDDSCLLLIKSERAGKDGESGSEERERLHVGECGEWRLSVSASIVRLIETEVFEVDVRCKSVSCGRGKDG